MLPEDAAHRRRVYDRVLATGSSLHAALEDMVIRTEADVRAFEDVTAVAHVLHATPFGGRYEKTPHPFGSDAGSLLRILDV